MITFTGVKNGDRKIQSVLIDIEQEGGNLFTDQMEVKSLMTLEGTDFAIGSEVSEINPKMLEERIEQNPFIKEAQVFRDLKGHLQVKVKQSKPIARLVHSDKQDQYIDVDGEILPVNAKHTARVPLINANGFKWEENLRETPYGTKVYELLAFIERDEFWKAQIAHVTVLENGEVELFPQITKQKIMLGKPDDLEKKFKNLMIFYKEILPKKGWNLYSQVNLKFDNQIICE